ncbi:hypothetical protein E8E11_004788 [Didymella keratinophila]|nr:hypothetical protein E8E11_004788 [Didymella keratinophila]
MDVLSQINPSSLFSAKGLVVVITGGGSGIGLAIAAALHQNGAHKIYIIGRRKNVLDDAIAKLESSPSAPQSPNVLSAIAADVTDLSSITNAVAQIGKETGYVDVLINNAGVLGPKSGQPIHDAQSIEAVRDAMLLGMEGNDWSQAFEINTKAVVGMSALFLPLLEAANTRRGWAPGRVTGTGNARARDTSKLKDIGVEQDDDRMAHIITVASVASYMRWISAGLAYNATKAAAAQIGKIMATFLAEWGSNNTENPGLIAGHAQYVKGAAEGLVGSVTGNQAWATSGEQDKNQAIDAMKAASENRDPSQGLGSVEQTAGNLVGCEGMQKEGEQKLNVGVPDLEYFTPQHITSPGTPAAPGTTKSVPKLFQPLTIRGNTLRNRILVAPMCQYSTASHGPSTGALTDYHIATLGHYALKGAALVMVEATGVQPNGRISPNCPGIWSDAQIPALRRVSDFIKSQGALSAIQLAHAGRKASTCAPWIAGSQRTSGGKRKVSVRASEAAGGWPEDVVGPMGGEAWTWDEKKLEDEVGGYWAPRALSEKEIAELVNDWARAAVRSVKAGVDVIEIHGAHGYLIHQFLSPITNQRTDKYGGSFENRTRLLLEIIAAIRAVIPASMPLYLRISATEWMEETELGKKFGSWDVESSIRLAKIIAGMGVDLLDVSSGGNVVHQKLNPFDTKDYQTRIAARIREEVKKDGGKLFIGAVGLITEAEQARDIVEEGGAVAQQTSDVEIAKEARAAVAMTQSRNGDEPQADVILVARQFMREPEWVLRVAHQLGVDVAWPNQFLRVRFPKL